MKKLILSAALAAFAAFGYNVIEVSPSKGVPFKAGGGKLVGVEVFAPTNGSVSLSRVWTAQVYTNFEQIVTNASGTYTTAIYSNLTTHVVYTNTADTMRGVFVRYPLMTPTDTNLATTVTALADVKTNVISVWSETVTTNISLVSGSADGHYFSGAPASDTYLIRDEVLVFDGTALGGFLRLILQ